MKGFLREVSSITQAYDEFINVAHEWDGGSMWDSSWNNSEAQRFAWRELKTKLYKAVANVNILEGIRFYVSFACSFAFGELKLMEGSAKIISLIARDENQHLAITQNILNNWKKGDDPEMVEIAEEQKRLVDPNIPRGSQSREAMGRVSVQRWIYDWSQRKTSVSVC